MEIKGVETERERERETCLWFKSIVVVSLFVLFAGRVSMSYHGECVRRRLFGAPVKRMKMVVLFEKNNVSFLGCVWTLQLFTRIS